MQCSGCHDLAPVGLTPVNFAFEIWIQKQVRDIRVSLIGLKDLLEKTCADDAASPPDHGNLAEVQIPVILILRLSHQLETLCVGADLGAVEGIVDGLNELCDVSVKGLELCVENLGCGNSLFLEGAEASCKNGLRDTGCCNTHVQSIDRGPLTGPLLSCGIEDNIYEGLASFRVLLPKDVGRDFDQEGIKNTLIPLSEYGAHFVWLHTEEIIHQGIGLTDHLHVAILNPVVHHFDVMACPIITDIGGAGNTSLDRLSGFCPFDGLSGSLVDLCGDGFPDGLTVDDENAIWLAHWGGSRITRFLPDGTIDGILEIPVPQVTSCTFGGPDRNLLFITTASRDLDLKKFPLAGGVFCTKTSVTGRASPRFKG